MSDEDERPTRRPWERGPDVEVTPPVEGADPSGGSDQEGETDE